MVISVCYGLNFKAVLAQFLSLSSGREGESEGAGAVRDATWRRREQRPPAMKRFLAELSAASF